MAVSGVSMKIVLATSAVLLTVAALAAPAPKETPSEPLTDAEKAGVRLLHRNTVEVFIDRPSFGIRRMPLNVEDLITIPKMLEKNSSPQIGNPVPPPLDKPVAKPKETHYGVSDLIGKDGMIRIPTDDKKEVWKVCKVQLVGLVKHPDPVVYLADKVPNMKDAKDVPTRELDAFEKAALTAIKEGKETLKVEKRGKEMRVLGPIYAGQRCVTCHEQKGQMLGAFSYQLERVPFDPEKEKNTPVPRIP